MVHVLSDDDTGPVLRDLIDAALTYKRAPNRAAGLLAGKRVALLFEQPSTRTRVSLEAAIDAMGGHAVVLRGDELQLGRGETIEDTARVLSRYVHAVALRTGAHERLERFAAAATVPVINALTERFHPCQALADIVTVAERKKSLDGVVLAYLGDGNNIAHSLMLSGAYAGLRVRVACPPGRDPDPGVVARARRAAASSGGAIEVGHDPRACAAGADVLYTDVWVSMGREGRDERPEDVFGPYRLGPERVADAAPDAIVMHCLPAHRGEEVAAEVIDGPRSVVWDQAGNRLFAQMALLSWLLVR